MLRPRPVVVATRLTMAEAEAVLAAAQAARLSSGQYLRQAGAAAAGAGRPEGIRRPRRPSTVLPSLDALARLADEVRRVGVNLNALARAQHAGAQVAATEMAAALEVVRALAASVRALGDAA